MDEIGRAFVRMEEMRNAYKILVEMPEGKKPLGRPRHRREDNIKMDRRIWRVCIMFIYLSTGIVGRLLCRR
jgi:hypothetical protein